MKSLFLSTIVICTLATAAIAGGNPVYIGVGAGLPSGPEMFQDGWKTGWGVSGGLGMPLGPRTELIGHVAYSRFAFDADGMLASMGIVLPPGASLEVDGGALTTLAFTVDIKHTLASAGEAATRPYLLGSIGIGRSDIEAATITASDGETTATERTPADDETGLSYGLGFGVEFDLSPGTALFVDGRYQVMAMEGDDLQFFPVRIGLRIGG